MVSDVVYSICSLFSKWENVTLKFLLLD